MNPPGKQVYVDYYEKLMGTKYAFSDIFTKQLANYFKIVEGHIWFVGGNGYLAEITLPFIPAIYHKLQEFNMRKVYNVTYMYDNKLSSDTLYSATYSTKVQNEIQQFFKDYQGFNYKKMKSADVEIGDLNMNPELTEEWNQIEGKEHIMFIV